MPIVELDGLRIDVTSAGEGPPVLLVHSSVSGHRQWRRLIERLKDRYHVVAPNLLGYGGTVPWTGDQPQTLDDAAAPVLALARRLDAPLRLVGHSWGGTIAMWVARQLGARVSHLALYEPMCYVLLIAHRREAAAAELLAMHADVVRLGGAGEWHALAERFTDYFNGDGSWAATSPERRDQIAAALPPNVLEWNACVPIVPDLFAGITSKGLSLCGTLSRLGIRETTGVIRAQYPQWQAENLEGCGHMAPLADPDRVNARLEAFLDSAPA